MRIAVHAKVLSERHLNGMGYYAYNLLKSLARIDTQNHYDLYTSHPLVHRIEAQNFHERICPFPVYWTTFRLPFDIIRNTCDLLFVPIEKLPPLVRCRKVITVHDLLTLREYLKSPISLTAKLHFLKAIGWTIRRADRVIAVSEATRRNILDIVGIDPDRVVVTPLGYDGSVFYPRGEEETERVKQKYRTGERYFINTSSLLWYRKNLVRLIRAFHGSRTTTDCRLVITGTRGEAYGDIMDTISRYGLEKDVILTGYVPLDDMPCLLSGAVALVFPSLHEGFGLPIVEAMACGCPVITSNRSSMPEVTQDAGILIDPYDEDAIRQAMIRIATDTTLRDELIIRGFERVKEYRWERTAELTLRVFTG